MTYAGLLSGLSKLGKAVDEVSDAAKKVDIPDNGLALTAIRLPDRLGDVEPAQLKPNIHGIWEVTRADGTVVQLDDFIKTADKHPPPLVIESTHLPNTLDRLTSIPNNVPVFIQNKNGLLAELVNGKPPVIKNGNVSIKVTDAKQLKEASWQLASPIKLAKTHFIDLSKADKEYIPSHLQGGSDGIQQVGIKSLLRNLPSFYRETIVVSGKVDNGVLIQGKNNRINVDGLLSHAKNNNVNLVILDSDKPKKILKQTLKNYAKPSLDFNESLSGFLTRVTATKKQQSALELDINTQNKSYTGIQYRPKTPTPQKTVMESY